jgi:cytochrome b561
MNIKEEASEMNQENIMGTSADLSKETTPVRATKRRFVGIRNSSQRYGLVAIVLHWLVAVAVFGLFALGLWMTDLTYYDDWYKSAPAMHKGIGSLLFLVMLLRVVWRTLNVTPNDEPNIGKLQRRIAHAVHLTLYLLFFVLMISGYLISTAGGRSIEVFGLFSVPAIIYGIPNQEDIAGTVHWYLALSLIGLVGLHAMAALKHHFIDRDRTLKKMLGISLT